MAKKTAKTVKTKPSKAIEVTLANSKSTINPLGDWLAGKPHDLIFAFHPGYSSDNESEDKFWHFLLPIGTNEPAQDWAVVRTGYSGYTPKGDLSQLAMHMILEPERVLNAIVDMPEMLYPREWKFIFLTSPRLSAA